MSWRKLGGTGKPDGGNNINVTSIVAEKFSLKDYFYGDLNVLGNISAKGSVNITANVFSQNLGAENLFANTTLKVMNNSTVYGSSAIKKDVYVYNRIIMGNIEEKENVLTYLQNDNTGNMTITQAQIVSLSGGLADVYTEGRIGVNTINPVAAFDLVNDMANTFNVQSNNELNYNVISRNAFDAGIMTMTDISACSVRFFVDSPMIADVLSDNIPDAFIKYNRGGKLTIQSPNTTFVNPLSIGSSNIYLPVLGETITVYDTSAGEYTYNTYNKAESQIGNGITIVSDNASTSTFINTITPNKNGFAFGGGAYPYDNSRTFGSIAYMDGSGGYQPAINIVSGTSKLKYKTTTGINIKQPNTTDRVLDVNGPTVISNVDVTVLANVPFEISLYANNREYSDYSIAIGYPYTLEGYPDTIAYDSCGNIIPKNYQQKVYATFDGGNTWMVSNFNNTDLGVALNPLMGAAIYDNSMVIVSAGLGFAFHSTNGGKTWYGIAGIPSSFMSNSAFICKIADTQVYRTILCSSDNAYWFDLPDSAYELEDEISTESLPNGIITFDMSVKKARGYHDNLFLIGDLSIEVYNISDPNLESISGITYTNKYTTLTENTYNDISVFSDTIAIAVGKSIITYTFNGGESWTELSYTYTEEPTAIFLESIVLNSVYIYSESIAVCVGYHEVDGSPIFFYSTDGFSTWKDDLYMGLLVNYGGSSELLQSGKIYNISLKNDNHIQFTHTISSYDADNNIVGSSAIYNCFLPSVFTPSTNTVLTLNGNMIVAGTITSSSDTNANQMQQISLLSNKLTIFQTTQTAINNDISGQILTLQTNQGELPSDVSLQDQITTLFERVAAVEIIQGDVPPTSPDLQTQIADLSIQIGEIPEGSLDLQSQIANLSTDIITKIGEIPADSQDLQTQIADLSIQIGEIPAGSLDLQSQIVELDSRISTQIGEIPATSQDLQSQITDLSTQIGEIPTGSLNLQSQIVELGTSISTQIGEIPEGSLDLQSQIIDLNTAISNLIQRLDAAGIP